MLITTGNANIEMAKNDKFILYFAHLIVPLASPKILTLGNAKKICAFLCISLAYPYLCTMR